MTAQATKCLAPPAMLFAIVLAATVGWLAVDAAQAGGEAAPAYSLRAGAVTSGGDRLKEGSDDRGFSAIGQPVVGPMTGGNYVLIAGIIPIFANRPPTVDAGADQGAYEGCIVALHADASDPDHDPLTYAWQQTAGKPVALSGADTADPSFTAPIVASVAEASLTFEVTVNDGRGGEASDTVNVRVYMAGDVDHNDDVNIFDVIALVNAFGSMPGDPNWDERCDFDCTGEVNVFDAIAIVNNFGRVLPP